MGGDAGVVLVWDEAVRAYDLGGGHPLDPVRVELTLELVRRTGLVRGTAREVGATPIDEGDLLRVHRPEYVEVVRALSTRIVDRLPPSLGLGPGDTPAFLGMHAAALAVCASTVEATRQVLEGRATHAFTPAGGLHHAMPDRAAGFCVYNDPAVAIAWALAHGAERVAYVDVDVHHGDGVETAFADDPRVLTVSIHESGRTLFPGTGDVGDTGGPGAPDSAVNVPLPAGTTGTTWLAAFDAVVDPVVRAFRPDLLVTQLGCDTHATDPLAHLMLTLDDLAATYARLHRLAHEAAGGRWVATGGGGYRLVDVVPRAWTLAFAEMAGVPAPRETPHDWRVLARARTGLEAPEDFDDPAPVVTPEVLAHAARGADAVVAALRAGVLARRGVRG